MKLLTKSFWSLAAALVLTAASHATPFDFSYTFIDGTLVTGTLQGTANGSYVDNASVTSLAFNGSAITGPIYTLQFDGFGFTTGGVVSFDASLNNFLFINTDYAGGDPFGESFAIVFSDFASASSIPLNVQSTDFPTTVENWSLTASNTAVPDSGTTAALVGFAALGLVGLRRRLAA